MHRRSSFDLVIRSIDGKLTARSEVVPGQSYLRRNYNSMCHSVQSEIAADLQVVLAVAERLSFDVGALEYDLRVLRRQQHDLAQLFIDDLLLLFRKYAICFAHRLGLNGESQRSGCD